MRRPGEQHAVTGSIGSSLGQSVQRLLGLGVVLRRRLLQPDLGLGGIGGEAGAALGEQEAELALRLGDAGQCGALVPVGRARAVGREAALGGGVSGS